MAACETFVESGEALHRVLSTITRTLAETLEPRAVFARIATSLRDVMPFDVIGLIRVEDAETVVVYSAFSFDGGAGSTTEVPGRRIRRSDYSPRLWPDGKGPTRIDDTRAALDPAFARDRDVLDAGLRSILRAPLRRGESTVGILWFGSFSPSSFQSLHECFIEPIADLFTLALEHERLASKEAERQRRLSALESLLPALSSALDIREVFNQVSVLSQSVLPHDRLVLGFLIPERHSVRIYAMSGERDPDIPEEIPLTETEDLQHQWDFVIARDTWEEYPADSQRGAMFRDKGYRSFLRVPIRLDAKVVGGLNFIGRSVGAFGEEDVEIARRIADHVALVVSHQRLAEEARRAEKAQERAALLEERVALLTRELASVEKRRIVGSSKGWKDVLSQATKVAATETTVLLTGESGTGKEVVSRFIHGASRRAKGGFVAVNCAALPDHLLESELFGYEKGAFTGASGSKPGRIEQAGGGTLFLDEVGETSPSVQAKLLRVLQEKEFQRLGATRPQKADVRVVAATNRDLKTAIQKGEFREDLFYRLSVFEIHLPPLRERPEDILLLVESFLEELGREVGRPAAGISREAREQLLSYPWPGNVRELRNAIERAIILCEGGLITAEHLPISVLKHDRNGDAKGRGGGSSAIPEMTSAGVDLEGVERSLVQKALTEARHNKSKAARLLGITRAQLYSRLQKYGLETAT